MVRDGIKAMLTTQPKAFYFDISEAECGEEAIRKILSENFNIVLMDYQLPDINGPEVISKILAIKPKAKILAFSNYDEYDCILNMKNAGSKGYVLKNISPRELILAIETVLAGRKYYAREVTEKINFYRRKKVKNKTLQEKLGITNRQVEILRLISSGMTNDNISKELNVAKRTIDSHRQNLLDKLGVNNTAALIKKATELGAL